MDNQHPFRRWLEASGYSARQVAKLCGVSRTAVYNWCSGSTAPSVRHLAVLHRVSHGAVQAWFWTQGDTP